jgi:transcriptional regulator with XRE-family HTH domain
MSSRAQVSEGVGERIAALMRRRQLGPSALAERSGVERELIDAALARDRITAKAASRLARALGAGEGYLLRGDSAEGEGFEIAVRGVTSTADDASGDAFADPTLHAPHGLPNDAAAAALDESVSQGERIVRLLRTLPAGDDARPLKLALLDALECCAREDALAPTTAIGAIRRRVESGTL